MNLIEKVTAKLIEIQSMSKEESIVQAMEEIDNFIREEYPESIDPIDLENLRKLCRESLLNHKYFKIEIQGF